MPFTFSHPAIILPITYLPKKWISLTGLVIGSLTPDFEYFLRMRIKSSYSHTIDGMFWFDLPLGLLVAFIFHNIVRDSLLRNLPTILRTRFSMMSYFNWNSHFIRNWYVVVISILIGAGSHILWDSFTHEHGHFVQNIASLQGSIKLFEKQIPIFKILQHGSTLLGGLAMIMAIYRLPTNQIDKENLSVRYWVTVLCITFVVIALKFLAGLETGQIGNVIVTTISAFIISLIFTPIILKKGRIITGYNNAHK